MDGLHACCVGAQAQVCRWVRVNRGQKAGQLGARPTRRSRLPTQLPRAVAACTGTKRQARSCRPRASTVSIGGCCAPPMVCVLASSRPSGALSFHLALDSGTCAAAAGARAAVGRLLDRHPSIRLHVCQHSAPAKRQPASSRAHWKRRQLLGRGRAHLLGGQQHAALAVADGFGAAEQATLGLHSAQHQAGGRVMGGRVGTRAGRLAGWR